MHADGIRELTGKFATTHKSGGAYWHAVGQTGVFVASDSSTQASTLASGTTLTSGNLKTTLSASRTVPTRKRIAPRAYGILLCVYLGS